MINPFNYWKYNNLEWEKMDTILNFDAVEEEINWKEFNIYINNQYYKTLDYVLMNGEEFYFDDNTKSYNVDGEKILLSKKSYFQLKNYSVVTFSKEDISIVSNFLKKYHHSFSDLRVKNKYIISSTESLYVVSNYYDGYVDNGNSSIFYTIFYRNKSRDYLLTDIEGSSLVHSYQLKWILDIDNRYDNFILSYTCEEAICYDMYQYKRGKYIRVIGSEEE